MVGPVIVIVPAVAVVTVSRAYCHLSEEIDCGNFDLHTQLYCIILIYLINKDVVI